jgi:hypothetical protein
MQSLHKTNQSTSIIPSNYPNAKPKHQVQAQTHPEPETNKTHPQQNNPASLQGHTKPKSKTNPKNVSA